jgi:hypothetical protein
MTDNAPFGLIRAATTLLLSSQPITDRRLGRHPHRVRSSPSKCRLSMKTTEGCEDSGVPTARNPRLEDHHGIAAADADALRPLGLGVAHHLAETRLGVLELERSFPRR